MVTLITILHIFVCLFLILVVLLQAGKGGGMGLAFGSSGAQTVFGGSGAGNFLTRLTAGTAVAFMLTSLTLAYFASAKQGAWLDEYEKRMSEQNKRDRAAREKLAAPTVGDGGVKATTTEPQTDQAPPAPSTGAATPAEGTPPAAETTTPAPAAAPAETKPAETKPAETKPAEKPAETKAGATKPAETKPAETKPAEKPAEPAKKPSNQ